MSSMLRHVVGADRITPFAKEFDAKYSRSVYAFSKIMEIEHLRRRLRQATRAFCAIGMGRVMNQARHGWWLARVRALGRGVSSHQAKALTAGAALLLATAPAAAQTAIEGDLIRIGDKSYRLWGIDAPEPPQIGADGWPAGAEATRAVAELIRGRAIVCDAKTYDRFGNIIAICLIGDADLGASIVQAGLAFALVSTSRYYIGYEAVARGVHAHDCEKPWDFRAQAGQGQ